MWRGRPLWAEIQLNSIEHNVSQIKRRVGPGTEVLAVVKANAYGHGAIPISKASLAAGAHGLAVACVDEGIQLRLAGIAAPILIMGYTPVWEAGKVVEHALTPTISARQLALALASIASSSGKSLPVHVKIDTGMNRFGVSPSEARDLMGLLQGLSPLIVEGVYTHFSTADELGKEFTQEQFGRFVKALDGLPQVRYRHVANSAAIADLPEMALDMVRPGISLYGCYPSRTVGRSLDLRPSFSLKSRVARLLDLSPGDSVSYGRTWIADKPSKVALVCCGYADGLPRLLSNQGNVLIRGARAPIVGRICMDQCLVDVTHLPSVAVEDEVVIIGRQGEEEITVEEVAAQAQTISYEILCGISARVPRVYMRGEEVLEVTTLTQRTEQDGTSSQLSDSL